MLSNENKIKPPIDKAEILVPVHLNRGEIHTLMICCRDGINTSTHFKEAWKRLRDKIELADEEMIRREDEE